ncbi:MAG: ABC transporter ATP-binding protein [Balneolaceae bacterium]|nr:ABC transporter ATP-binding protein [Balneolaceae bacterium]
MFQNLTFEYSGNVLGIAGNNGSGKTTLMKCLSFLLRPTNGSLYWEKDGKAIDAQTLKSMAGYAAPYINLYAELTVKENLTFLLKVNNIPVFERKLDDLLQRVQLSELGNQLFGSLSTGQQQRTKLAAALVRDPEIIFLDEPGSNLDKKGHALVQDIVEETSQHGKMIVLASNDPHEIDLCDRVIRLTSE